MRREREPNLRAEMRAHESRICEERVTGVENEPRCEPTRAESAAHESRESERTVRRTNANQDPSPGESRARRDGEHVRVFHRLQPWTINFPPPTAVSPKASCIIPFEPAMPLSMIPASSMVLLLCLAGLNLRPFAQYPWITGVYIYPGVTRPLD